MSLAAESRAQRNDIRAAALALLREGGIADPPISTSLLLEICKLETDTFAFSEMLPAPMPGKRESTKAVQERERLARMDLDVKVRGILDTQDSMVYTHNSLKDDQRRFCTFHELGHFTLAWHRELFYKCNELDMSPAVLAGLEQDANWFASDLAFLGDRFVREIADYRISIHTIRQLTKIYKTSFEATARHYVESLTAPVALIVAAPRPDLGSSHMAGEPLLTVRYAITTAAMRRMGNGYIAPHTLLAWRHPATNLFLSRSNKQDSAPETLTFAPSGTALPCETELYYNGYDVFILARPLQRW